jgi:hypothetical protein
MPTDDRPSMTPSTDDNATTYFASHPTMAVASLYGRRWFYLTPYGVRVEKGLFGEWW